MVVFYVHIYYNWFIKSTAFIHIYKRVCIKQYYQEEMAMIEIISGEKGKGKTKELLSKVNASITSASGNIVYLDKSQKHMYELNNKVRLINVTDYPIDNCDEFLGFICGIVSQDNDLEEMYLDSFLTIAGISDDEQISHAIQKLDVISEKYNVKFVLSVSRDKALLPECAKAKIVISL